MPGGCPQLLSAGGPSVGAEQDGGPPDDEEPTVCLFCEDPDLTAGGQPLLGERAPHYCDEHYPNRVDVPPHL